MGKKRLGAAHDEENVPDGRSRHGFFLRLRALPGFRVAAVAFVLTVVLGAGSTIAYAYWSQSATVAITGTTRPEAPVPTVTPVPSVPAGPAVPAGTTLVTANPVLVAHPPAPTWKSCTPAKSPERMKGDEYADITFAWTASPAASKYVVTVKSTNPAYKFIDGLTGLDEKTEPGPQTSFRFKRIPSQPNGEQQAGPDPFYTIYTVRVMPMNGDVAGDPLYFTYKYEHQNASNCYEDKKSTGASPVGSAAPLVCNLQTLTRKDFADATFTWAGATGADSYSVTLLANNGSNYGAETSVRANSQTFRILWPPSTTENSPFISKYTLRVQPMKGKVAGDPVYKTYRLGFWDHGCD